MRTLDAPVFSFFFQADDGIRDGRVTGVQTCALPICGTNPERRKEELHLHRQAELARRAARMQSAGAQGGTPQIGRASCRERVCMAVVAVALERILSDEVMGAPGVMVVGPVAAPQCSA